MSPSVTMVGGQRPRLLLLSTEVEGGDEETREEERQESRTNRGERHGLGEERRSGPAKGRSFIAGAEAVAAGGALSLRRCAWRNNK